MRKRRQAHHHEMDEDINIVPILDAMVSIIIFLLFAISSVTVRKIDLHTFGAQTASQEEIKEQKDIELPILKIEAKDNFEFNKQKYSSLNELYEAAVKFKEKYPFNFQIKVSATAELDVENMAEILSKLRALKTPFTAKNAKGEEVQMTLLFPDAILEDA